ncbi:MAG: tetratricopeptide repeat protein, partial [Omnitrophica WOR_2 bacterium]
KGLVRWAEGDHAAAEAMFRRSLELYQELGDQWGVANVMIHLGTIASNRNEDDHALFLLEQSYTIYRRLGDLFGIGRSSQRLGEFYLKQGNLEKAGQFFELHLQNDEKLHFKQGIVIALLNLGELSRHKGEYEKAEQYYMESLAISREIGDEWAANSDRINLGLAALHKKDYQQAKRWFSEVFDTGWIVQREFAAYDLISGLAAVAAGMDQPERAAKLSGAAQAILARTDFRPSSLDESERERHIRIARGQIGDELFERYAADGSQMTLEQVVAFALDPGQ